MKSIENVLEVELCLEWLLRLVVRSRLCEGSEAGSCANLAPSQAGTDVTGTCLSFREKQQLYLWEASIPLPNC